MYIFISIFNLLIVLIAKINNEKSQGNNMNLYLYNKITLLLFLIYSKNQSNQ
jgi:hypothetical protein